MVISINDFIFDARMKLLFESKMWEEGEDLILNLEKYKVVDRTQIIMTMEEKGYKSLVSYSNLPEALEDPDGRYKDIPKDLVFITKSDSGKTRYIANIFSELDTNVLLISAPDTDYEVVYVTPHNWNEITGVRTEWEYSILLKRFILDCMSKKGRDMHLTIETPGGIIDPIIYYRTPKGLERSKLFDVTGEDINSMVMHMIERMTYNPPKDLKTIEGVQVHADDIFGNKTTNLRISAMKIAGGFRATCRIQDASTTSFRIDQLNFPSDVTADIREIANKDSGLTFIAGRPNTGKNTTMFAMVNEISQKPIGIMGFFSPIEAWLPATLVDYKNSEEYLTNLVRLTKTSDTDVILIGEIPSKGVAHAMRDLVNSSMHVVTTFHVDRLWHLPYKLYEYFGDDYKGIFSQMNACMNQKMYTHLCPKCKDKVAVSELPQEFQTILRKHGVEFCYKNRGCYDCDKLIRNQPYMERLIFTPELVSEILKLDKPYEVEQLLEEHITTNQLGLEFQLSRAIGEGFLPASSLHTIC